MQVWKETENSVRVAVNDMEGILLNFLILSRFAYLWDYGYVYYHYSYVLSSGKKVSKVSERCEIRKREIH